MLGLPRCILILTLAQQLMLIVLDAAHLDSGILPDTLLESIELLQARHTHHDRVRRPVVAFLDYLHPLLGTKITGIALDLLLQLHPKLVLLIFGHLRSFEHFIQ